MWNDAIDLLEQDFRTVCTLLDELLGATDEVATARTKLLQQVERELDVHMRIQEEIFYPALRQEAGRDEADIPLQESADHRAVERMVLPDLMRTEPGTPEFSGRARVLKEMVEHHARLEQEDLFPRARELLSPGQLADLGRRLDARRRELR